MINANNVGDILPFLIQDSEVFNRMNGSAGDVCHWEL
jgi:hypothetical protein